MWLTQIRGECKKIAPQELSDRIQNKENYKISPFSRYKHAVCTSSDGFIYIYGGKSEIYATEADVWRYDLHKDTWKQLETYGEKPPNLQEHSLVEYDGKLYLFGGKVSAVNTESSLWQLDLKSYKWSLIDMQNNSKSNPQQNLSNRRGHSALVYKDSMYIFGGYEDFKGSSSQLWEFQLLTERYELCDKRASSRYKPEQRHNHSAIIYQDSMYVYGGLSNLKPLNDLWRWSWKEKRWFKERTRGQSPGHLYGHSAIQAFGSMFIFGGERNGRKTCRVWRLNLANLRWQRINCKGSQPSASVWHGAVSSPLNILDERNYIIMAKNVEQTTENLDICDTLSFPLNVLQKSPLSIRSTSTLFESIDSFQNLAEVSKPTELELVPKRKEELNDNKVKVFQDTDNGNDETSKNLNLKVPTKVGKFDLQKSLTLAPLDFSSQVNHSKRSREIKLTGSLSYETHIAQRKSDHSESEVVQALIERADSQIKQLYTPYFTGNIERRKRSSLCEEPARQKLAKTTTNYSLFHNEQGLSILSDQMKNDVLTRNKFSTFRDICNKAILMEEGYHSNTIRKITSEHSLLDGHRSESRTIRDVENELERSSSRSSISCITLASSKELEIKSFENALTAEDEQQIENYDVTSFSFSNIVEYEEDDVLQSSSNQSLSNFSINQLPINSTSSSKSPKYQLEEVSNDKIHLNYQNDSVNQTLSQIPDLQNESTSSGYKSIYGNVNNSSNLQRINVINNSDTSCNFSSAVLTESLSQKPSQDLTKSDCLNSSQSYPVKSFGQNNIHLVKSQSSSKSPSIPARVRLARFLWGNRKKENKSRYWQLCMIIFGGKQDTISGVSKEPITVWRLYI